MLVFDTEKNPHSSATDLRKSDEERYECTVLKIVGVYCIEYPIESKNGIKEHRKVVPVRIFVSTDIAEETLRGVGL